MYLMQGMNQSIMPTIFWPGMVCKVSFLDTEANMRTFLMVIQMYASWKCMPYCVCHIFIILVKCTIRKLWIIKCHNGIILSLMIIPADIDMCIAASRHKHEVFPIEYAHGSVRLHSVLLLHYKFLVINMNKLTIFFKCVSLAPEPDISMG